MEAAKMSKSIWGLEKEREKYSSDASEAAAKYQQVCALTKLTAQRLMVMIQSNRMM